MLVSNVKMHRRPLALAIVLLLAGLTPATVIIGFCARMPCCAHASTDQLALTTGSEDCCTTIACYEPPSLKLSIAPVSSHALLALPALVSVMPAGSDASAAILITQAFTDTSPPAPLRHRLAILSTLLI